MDPNRVDELFQLMKEQQHEPSAKKQRIVPTTADDDKEILGVLSHEQRRQIADARRERSLTQAQLAQQSNVKPDLVHALESGKPVQDHAVLAKINKALGLDLAFRR